MASMACRSAIVRRASANSQAKRTSFSSGAPSRASNFNTRQNPIAAPRLLRRELSSYKRLHSAIASSYLVSKLPSEASTSTKGRFAKYLSPI